MTDSGQSTTRATSVHPSGFATLNVVGERSKDLMVVIDEAGKVKYANPAALATFGIANDDEIGANAFTFVHPDDLERAIGRFLELIKSPGSSFSDTIRALVNGEDARELEIVSTNCLDDPAVGGIVINGRDVTEQKKYVAELEARESWFRALLTNESDLNGVINAQGIITYVGLGHTNFSGRPRKDRIGRHILEHIHPDDADTALALLDDVVATGGTSQPLVVRAKALSGEWRYLEVVLTNCLDDPIIQGIVYNIHDVTALKDAEQARHEAEQRDEQTRIEAALAIAQSEERFRLAFEGNMSPMLFIDLEDQAFAVNDAFCQMIGRTREEVLEYHSIPYTHPDDIGLTADAHRRLSSGEVDQLRYVKRYIHREGHSISVEVSRYAARDHEGCLLYSVLSAREITEELALKQQLERRALHDPLTGLANHVLFQDRLSRAHARVVRNGGLGAVLLLDLDDFQGVNDTHGHLIGDELLQEVARRLESVTQSTDTLCRFSGDEFLYLAVGIATIDEVEHVAHRLLEVLSEPFTFADIHFQVRASIGVSVWDDTSPDSSDLIKNADVALYEAKTRGKDRFVIFTANMQTQAVNRFTLIQELHRALHNGEISMNYQPIVDLATNRVIAFEALMRWTHPERGEISPAVFIPLAEGSDLILHLGAFAIREAANAVASWQSEDEDFSQPYVTVNLSARQFHDPKLLDRIEDALKTNDLAPCRMVIEITESAALLNVAETLNIIEALNNLGIGIALDDFGTGYSSLSYLLRLRPTMIKIDQSFVRPTHSSEENTPLLEVIVSLGNKLQMTMLAEGIETIEQFELLRDLNCELGQGFLWSPAVPFHETADLVHRVLTV